MTRLRYIALGLAMGACSPADARLESWPLESGGTIAGMAPAQEQVVVLLVAPSDFFRCANHISRWLEWSRSHPGRFRLVYTRPPTEGEGRQLSPYRVRVDATLRRTRAEPPGGTPYELLLSRGNVVYASRVSPGMPDSPLLRAMEEGQVEELLQQPERAGKHR